MTILPRHFELVKTILYDNNIKKKYQKNATYILYQKK